MATWIKFEDYILHLPVVFNLDAAVAFMLDAKKQEISVSAGGDHPWQHHVSQKRNPDVYQKTLEYIQQTTGYSF